MEKSGETLDRVYKYYGIWSSNRSTPEFRVIQGEMAPILSEFNSKISQALCYNGISKSMYISIQNTLSLNFKS